MFHIAFVLPTSVAWFLMSLGWFTSGHTGDVGWWIDLLCCDTEFVQMSGILIFMYTVRIIPVHNSYFQSFLMVLKLLHSKTHSLIDTCKNYWIYITSAQEATQGIRTPWGIYTLAPPISFSRTGRGWPLCSGLAACHKITFPMWLCLGICTMNG